MVKRVLIADKLHITRRNFASLIEYFTRGGYEQIAVEHPPGLLTAFGKYSESSAVMAYAEGLAWLSADELYALRHGNTRLFSIARLELMSRIAADAPWLADDDYGVNERDLFDRIFSRSHEALIENLAAARFWCERWDDILRKTAPATIALVFSGSLIYARAFAEIMHRRQGTLYICESFFTGKDYYLELRHSPLPNQTLLRGTGLYNAIQIPDTGASRRGLRALLLAKLGEMKNKNVQQPPASGLRIYPMGKKVVVIFGQVLNDFSLLNTGATGFHSLSFYRRCICALLEHTEVNIIFKSHPWERKKDNILSPLTMDTLSTQFADHIDRLKIVEDYPIGDLLQEADFVIGINSQSLLEAALAGIKPMQAGNAFYGNKGFTYDISDIGQIIKIVNQNNSASLSVDEYRSFETFMLKATNRWLIPESVAEGLPRLVEVLGRLPATKSVSQTATTRKALPTTTNVAVQKTAVVADKALAQRDASANVRDISPSGRKLNKLRQTPYAFFRDARSPLLRVVAKLF